MKILKGLSKVYYKNFKKNSVLRVQVIDELSRIKTYYVKTQIKDGKVINLEGRTYILDKDSVFLYEGISTILFSYKNYSPKNIDVDEAELRPLNIHEEQSEITPDELNTMLDNKIVEDMFKANKDKKKDDMMFMAIMGIAVVSLFNLYLTYNIAGEVEWILYELDHFSEEVLNLLGNLR